MAANTQSAKNPNLFNTRSTLRPLNNSEMMRRAKAMCAQTSPSSTSCSGQIFLGIFFDGTGNNEKKDFIDVSNPGKQKHSNVVRLYHAYPHGKIEGTNRYFAEYVPGVGTPFPEIGDDGGVLGTAVSWNGEDRIIWGMLTVLNNICRYVSGEVLIPLKQAGVIANNVGGVGNPAFMRRTVFKTWTEKLKAKIDGRAKSKPMPEQVNISVFGFSRGAAEARAFVNWFFDICAHDGETHSLAGVPVNIGFLGIFDTVASVGIAGGFSNGALGAEGRQSWANDNMQIHPGVESCLHIVAANDVRATFPVDSVRVDGKYPANVTEYVYPGSHSDVGGGYAPGAQGKTDEIARIAGFEMYCAALAAGVPFLKLTELKLGAKSALIPKQSAVDAFNSYYSKARIREAPVEDMMRQHMAHYFTYRYQARRASGVHPEAGGYYNRKFYKTAPTEAKFLRDSQQRFIAVLASVSGMIDYIMKNETEFDKHLPQPYQVAVTGSTMMERIGPGSMAQYPYIFGKRLAAGDDDKDNGQADVLAQGVRSKVEKWKQWLSDNASPFLVDADAPERDILSVVQTLSDEPQPMEIVEFFDHWVHDSMAGLHSDKMDEFLLNGIGIAKFRRVYFGDNADDMTRGAAATANEAKLKAAKAIRHQRKQWALESAEFARTR